MAKEKYGVVAKTAKVAKQIHAVSKPKSGKPMKAPKSLKPSKRARG